MMRLGYFFNPAFFGVEIILTLLIAVLCLLIFFRTKDVFALTKHKGIQYFRNTFLFFALAYIFRLVLVLIQLSMIHFEWYAPRWIMMPLSMVLTTFLSTLAIISLFLSTSWKKMESKWPVYVLYLAVLIILLLSFITRELLIPVVLQALLLVFTAVVSYSVHKKSGKFSRLFVIYILLFLFWIVGLIPLINMRPFPFEFNIISQAMSIAIFTIIFYKVNKWAK